MRAKAAAMNPALKLVSERFGEVEGRAARRYESDESFRDLCDDYAACAQTLARLESEGPPSAGIRNEYGALLLRLEGELLRYLESEADRDQP
jgi:hypothetical protein